MAFWQCLFWNKGQRQCKRLLSWDGSVSWYGEDETDYGGILPAVASQVFLKWQCQSQSGAAKYEGFTYPRPLPAGSIWTGLSKIHYDNARERMRDLDSQCKINSRVHKAQRQKKFRLILYCTLINQEVWHNQCQVGIIRKGKSRRELVNAAVKIIESLGKRVRWRYAECIFMVNWGPKQYHGKADQVCFPPMGEWVAKRNRQI